MSKFSEKVREILENVSEKLELDEVYKELGIIIQKCIEEERNTFEFNKHKARNLLSDFSVFFDIFDKNFKEYGVSIDDAFTSKGKVTIKSFTAGTDKFIRIIVEINLSEKIFTKALKKDNMDNFVQEALKSFEEINNQLLEVYNEKPLAYSEKWTKIASDSKCETLVLQSNKNTWWLAESLSILIK